MMECLFYIMQVIIMIIAMTNLTLMYRFSISKRYILLFENSGFSPKLSQILDERVTNCTYGRQMIIFAGYQLF